MHRQRFYFVVHLHKAWLRKRKRRQFLDKMLLSGEKYTKMVKSKNSFSYAMRSKREYSQIARICEQNESSRVHSAISLDNLTQPSHVLVTMSPSEEVQEIILYNHVKRNVARAYITL